MRLVWRLLVLGLVALIFCAPLFRGLTSLDQENDEAIYSYAVESILDTSDWLNPRLSPTTDQVFLEKPPLKFWIVALPIHLGLLPRNDFGLRFWDPVFGSLAFLYIFSFGRRMAGWACGVGALLTLYAFQELFFLHGIRGNNMEASLVLAYAGGLYHFLRWTESDRQAVARGHAAAVGLYFFLAFMTKFVASLFLPVIMAAACLELPGIRTKALREWRTWLAVCGGFLLLASPWFVYQSFQPGHGVWRVMFGEHVVARFSTSLDPAHLKPWHYYFDYLYEKLSNAGALWVVVAGALLMHARALRERWPAGTLVLYWFWLPVVLISLGTSKLWYYMYPFLAPAALAAGYAIAWAGDLAARAVAAITAPERARTIRPPRALARLVPTLRRAWPWGQRLLLALAIASLVLAAIGLVHPGRFRVLGLIVRPPQVLRSALTALLLSLLAGRGAAVARPAVALVLLTFLPLSEYRWTGQRTQVEAHPLRSTGDCMARVQRNEKAAGRPVRGVYVYLPGRTYLHSYFFYYRSIGWESHDGLSTEDFLRILDDPDQQRPVLMPEAMFLRIHRTEDPAGTFRPSVQVNDGISVVLPGPYAECAR